MGLSKTKRIQQYDLNNNLIKKWESISEASNQLKINCGHIGSCCKGDRKTAGGFIWKYTDTTGQEQKEKQERL